MDVHPNKNVLLAALFTFSKVIEAIELISMVFAYLVLVKFVVEFGNSDLIKGNAQRQIGALREIVKFSKNTRSL